MIFETQQKLMFVVEPRCVNNTFTAQSTKSAHDNNLGTAATLMTSQFVDSESDTDTGNKQL